VVLSAKANFKVLGPRLGKRTRDVAARIEALDHVAVAAILDGTSIIIDDEVITADDLIITRAAAEGMAVATEGSVSLAIDTELTEDLLVEGTAREVISRIQSMRRASGLAVTDRIVISWSSGDDRIGVAFAEHGDMIAGEVLAVEVTESADSGGETIEVNGTEVRIAILKSN
jgi:isoleucyl-tRNA synthetase